MPIDTKNLPRQVVRSASVAIPEALEQWLRRYKRLYIEGKWTDGVSRDTFATLNPATGEELSEVYIAKRPDVDAAVHAARAAFESGAWSKMPLRDRALRLKRLGDLILEHRLPLAILESLDTGKPITEAYDGDIPRAASNFHFFADLILEEKPLIFDSGEGRHLAFREPLGVAALVTPWNLPLYLETWKLAPCLVMGNSAILKPSELTPLTASYLAELVEQIDLPPGVFTLLHGLGEGSTGEFLVSHAGIDAISFTGETATGRAIMKAASIGPTRVSFELGGKGAGVVFADSPWEEAIASTVRAAFRNQGEICLANSRVFVEASCFEAFVDEVTERAGAIRVGHPLAWDTGMGALISQSHREKVASYVRSVESPAKIRVGGQIPDGLERGSFFSPTVITGLSHDHRVSQEEIFGPVVSIYPFESEDEVIKAVNGTPYGLSASVWTGDSEKAHRVSAAIRAGLVWINSWFVRDLRVPFGGQKRSGVGREGGVHSLSFFSEWKSVYWAEGAAK